MAAPDALCDSLSSALADTVPSDLPDAPTDSLPSDLPDAPTDSLLDTWLGPLFDASLDSLHEMILLSKGDRRVVITYGCEVEGLQESFGGESLTSIGVDPGISIVDPLDDQLEGLRFKEHEIVPMAVLGFSARTAAAAPLKSSLDLEAKAGEERRSLSLEAFASRTSGALKDLSLRSLFFWDRGTGGNISKQGLFYMRWKPRLGRSDWRFNARTSFDLSRTDESDIKISLSGKDLTDADSIGTAWLGFLNYEKLSLRLELCRIGRSSSCLALDLNRKWVEESRSGSYQGIALLANQSWFCAWGLLDLDAELKRRHYDRLSSVLGSFWELELGGRWLGGREPLRFEGDLTLTGTRYDHCGDDYDEFESLEDDCFRAQADLLLRRTLMGGLFSARTGELVDELEIGAGPIARLLRLKHAAGDAVTLGGRFEVSVRGGARRSAWWLECSLEGGRRNYRASGTTTRLTFEGLSLSLSQTDYAFAEASAMGGGALPFSFEWEGYFSLGREWHTADEDNARLLSFSVALKRRWVLWGP